MNNDTPVYEDFALAPFGDGFLVVEQQRRQNPGALVDPGPKTPRLHRRLLYRDVSGVLHLSTLADVLTVADELDVHLEGFVSDYPAEYARMVVALLDRGTAVTTTSRFAYLERDHSVPLAENAPRYDTGALCFLCLTVSLRPASHRLVSMRLDLATMRLEESEFARV